MRRLNDYILLYLKGISMGAASLVPGMSGSTIAFITGIYDELLHALKSIDLDSLKLLTSFQIYTFWKKINGNFIACVLGGIVTSYLILTGLVIYLLKYHPVLIWSFFFGLILMSAPLVLREIRKWNIGAGLSFILGIVGAYAITMLSPTQTPDALWFIFVAGILTMCAAILPGISGAFILLLIGKYQYIMTSLSDFSYAVILVFTIGGIIGLLSFSRLVCRMLDQYHSVTIALLAGFMLGSLNKIWPWREVLEYVTDKKGEQIPVFEKSILPWHYMTVTGKDPLVFQAIGMMALGVFIVVLIERVGVRIKTKI